MVFLLKRALFALKYQTLKKIVQSKDSPNHILVFHQGKISKMIRRCPHMGAPLERGWIKDDFVVCPWHGCKLHIETQAVKPLRTCEFPQTH